jgi:hypothetical protein
MEGIEDPGLVPNIKMQKTGARVEFGAVCPLPASDLGRWTKPLRGRFKN